MEIELKECKGSKEVVRMRKFIAKWSRARLQTTRYSIARRSRAYQKFFHAGESLYVEYGVNIDSSCNRIGNLSIGSYVLFARDVELDISGVAYKNFKTTMQQDNLYHLGHGIYQLPIARFIYTPAGGTFSDYL